MTTNCKRRQNKSTSKKQNSASQQNEGEDKPIERQDSTSEIKDTKKNGFAAIIRVPIIIVFVSIFWIYYSRDQSTISSSLTINQKRNDIQKDGSKVTKDDETKEKIPITPPQSKLMKDTLILGEDSYEGMEYYNRCFDKCIISSYYIFFSLPII